MADGALVQTQITPTLQEARRTPLSYISPESLTPNTAPAAAANLQGLVSVGAALNQALGDIIELPKKQEEAAMEKKLKDLTLQQHQVALESTQLANKAAREATDPEIQKIHAQNAAKAKFAADKTGTDLQLMDARDKALGDSNFNRKAKISEYIAQGSSEEQATTRAISEEATILGNSYLSPVLAGTGLGYSDLQKAGINTIGTVNNDGTPNIAAIQSIAKRIEDMKKSTIKKVGDIPGAEVYNIGGKTEIVQKPEDKGYATVINELSKRGQPSTGNMKADYKKLESVLKEEDKNNKGENKAQEFKYKVLGDSLTRIDKNDDIKMYTAAESAIPRMEEIVADAIKNPNRINDFSLVWSWATIMRGGPPRTTQEAIDTINTNGTITDTVKELFTTIINTKKNLIKDSDARAQILNDTKKRAEFARQAAVKAYAKEMELISDYEVPAKRLIDETSYKALLTPIK